MIDFGYVPANTTLYIPFNSFGADGQSLTLTGLAVTDIECFKNGSVTQRSSDNGIALLDTDGIDFDGITGLHGFSIDLSDNSDSGFWSVGGQYWIVVSSVTINSQTVSFIAATFRIRPAESQAGYPKVDAQYVEGSDATDQIRDAVVDDSTRIDGSALNTASGTTIPAISTELAKVPKSDGTTIWNSTAVSQLRDEMDDAIADYGPVQPTVAGRQLFVAAGGQTAPDLDNAIGTLAKGVELTGFNDLSEAQVNAQADQAITDAALATAAELAKVPKSDGSVTWNATALASINAQADQALSDYDGPTNAEMEARTLPTASYATATALSTLAAIFSGITSLAQWLGSMAGKQTPDSTAQTEMRATGAGNGTFAAGNDSLEALRDRGDAAWTGGGGGGGPVQASVVVPAASARAVLQGSTIGITRGDTLRVTFTNLGDLTGRDKLWFTCKQSKNAADSAAIIQIEETDNLTILNGAAPSSAAWGNITVIDANTGEVDLLLYAAATKLLTVFDGYAWDVKQSLGSNPDDAATLTEGKLNVEANVTLATS